MSCLVQYYDNGSARVRLVDSYIESSHFTIAIALVTVLKRLLSEMEILTQKKITLHPKGKTA